MVQTRAQWNAFMKRIPLEDRTTYEQYLESIGATEPVATSTTSTASGASRTDSAASRTIPTTTTTTPTPVTKNPWDEPPGEAPEGFSWKWIGAKSVGRAGSGSWQLLRTAGSTAATNNWKGSGTTSDPLTFNGSPFTGIRNGANYVNGVLKTDSTNNQGGQTTGSGTQLDPLLVNGKPFNGVLGGVTYVNGVAQSTGSGNQTPQDDIETKTRKSAQQEFLAALNELGLGDLYSTVNDMITQDKTVATIKLELPKTEAYKQRFPGMEALRKAGLAINEATYISNERGYLQTLRAYGLDTAVLGSRENLGTYISNMVAPREFEERVNMAATRVKENPDVIAAFKSYYPSVDESAITAYLLNPKQGIDIIRKQVRVSELGAAAQYAGFAKDVLGTTQAESLISAAGDTAYAGLRTEFQKARQLANTQRRLAQIEGQQYTDLEAISAVVGDDVTSALASERRAAREAARFSAGGGITGASLRSTATI